MITSKDMLTAEQARTIAQANYDKRVQAEVDDINADILIAVNEGKMGITISALIYPETKKYLEDLGYTVGLPYCEFRNDDCTEISWREAD